MKSGFEILGEASVVTGVEQRHLNGIYIDTMSRVT